MNLRLTISVLFLTILGFHSYGQQVDTTYYDTDWKVVPKNNSTYHRISFKDDEGKILVTDYFNTGEIQMTGRFLSLSPDVQDGVFTWYHKNGQKQSEKRFVNGKQITGQNWEEDGKTVDMLKLDVQPEYPGGIQKFYAYLGENFAYPAISNRPKGTIFMSFVINSDGSITDVTVQKPLHKLLDAEAVRVLQKMPHWKPGIQNGKPVRVRYNIPISMK
ncbi:MAG: energy transducer TonB [Pedobacter sp.]|nr:MAG: energy transducer TonB [Pedobacter sp.]